MQGSRQSLVRPALGHLCKALGKKLIAPRLIRRRNLSASMNFGGGLANCRHCRLQQHPDECAPRTSVYPPVRKTNNQIAVIRNTAPTGIRIYHLIIIRRTRIKTIEGTAERELQRSLRTKHRGSVGDGILDCSCCWTYPDKSKRSVLRITSSANVRMR